jgi:hypothetical protein
MPEAKGDTIMATSRIALALALVLGGASAAMAAPKDPARHETTIQQQVPAGTYLNIDSRTTGSVRSTGPAIQPSDISPRGFERLAHLIEAFDAIGFQEDAGD